MVFDQKLKTTLNITSEIKNEVTLTTSKTFNFESYIIHASKLSVTESQNLITNLPKKSNIKMVEKILDKYHKTQFQSNIFESITPNYKQKYYTDMFGISASKYEDINGDITFNLRGDIAMNIIKKGNIFVQCNKNTCNALFPRKIDINLLNFSLNKIDGGNEE